MRRGGFLLVMLGAFFLTLAPLTRFYVADRVIAAPLDYQQMVDLEASDAAVLDLGKNKVLEGVKLEGTLGVNGDVRAGDDETAVWTAAVTLRRKETRKGVSEDILVGLLEYKTAFDRRTGELKNAKGTHVDLDESVVQSGYGLVWPIANVQKTTYNVFDYSTGRTWPAKFSGIEKVEGITAYRFVQHVEPTPLGKSKKPVSPTVVGLPAKAKPVKVDRMHESMNTFWVDPRTGSTIKMKQAMNATLKAPDGHEGTFIRADLVTTGKSVKALAKRSEDMAGQISLVRTMLPGVALLAGLALLAVGGILTLFPGVTVGKRGRHGPSGDKVEHVSTPVNDLLARGQIPK